MNLQDIHPVISQIRNNPLVTDLRGHTYLSTYPDIMSLAQQLNTNSERQFRQLALMVYGWMPRVLRINPSHSHNAALAMTNARNTSIDNYKSVNIQDISNSLHSLVGASKLLHFINPDVFPIWDSKIQAFCGRSNSNNAMGNISNYYKYVDEVHSIIADPAFPAFYENYITESNNRLIQSNINQYQVSPIRAVEASAFELAP